MTATLAIVWYLAAALHLIVKRHEYYWALPLALVAVFVFAYRMSDLDEREEFKAFGRLLMSPLQWRAAWRKRRER